jgi:hypothetical protein
MNYLAGILALVCGLEGTALFYYKDKADNFVANSKIAAVAAITHAQAITASDTLKLQAQGRTAVASAASTSQAAQIRYKTVYVPILQKMDPKACANQVIPSEVLAGLK